MPIGQTREARSGLTRPGTDVQTRKVTGRYRHVVAMLVVISFVAACSSIPPPTATTGAPTASPVPSPLPTVAPVTSPSPAIGLTRDQAVALAREAAAWVPASASVQAKSGTFGDLRNAYGSITASPRPSEGELVWRIDFFTKAQEQGTQVVVDYTDGRVIQVSWWIS